MTKKKIGIIDSGLGGLGLLKELVLLNPDHEYIYLADQEFAPYGLLEGKKILERSIILCEKLLTKEVEGIVIACNTATAHGIETLRLKFDIPFVGVEPYLNFFNHGPADQRTLVLMTKATMNSQRFIDLRSRLDPELKMGYFAATGLASLIEKWLWGNLRYVEMKYELHKILEPLKKSNWSHVLLGCTHYPFLKNEIESYLEAQSICPSKAVARQAAEVFKLGKAEGISRDIISTKFLFASYPGHCFELIDLCSFIKNDDS